MDDPIRSDVEAREPELRDLDARSLAARALQAAPDDVELEPLAGPASQAQLWRATDRGGSGRPVVVKRHRAAGSAVREVRALRKVARHLPEGTAPRLVLDVARRGWLAMTWVPGSTPDQSRDAAELGPGVDEAVGAVLRRLHDGQPAPDSLGLVEAWERRSRALGAELRALGPTGSDGGADGFEPWLERSRADLLRWLRAQRPARVPCHRDVAPRNLRLRVQGDRFVAGLVDFAHARADLALVDVARWCNERGGWDDAGSAAFWRGYGHRPDEAMRRALEAVRIHDALTAIAWGTRHDQAARVALGRRALADVARNGLG